MPSLATRNSAPTVATDVINLPPNFPELPGDVTKRFVTMNDWEEEVGDFWRKARQVITDGIQSHSNAIARTTKADTGNLRVLIDDLQAAVTNEQIARIAGDAALAASITTVVASVGTKSRISVQSFAPSAPAINDLWLDTSDSNRYKFWDGLAWQYKQDLVLAAAVSTESSARATADGFLEGKYTLTVVAGNVVTGMNITSSTGGGTNVSSVIFRATDFLIYNSVTGVAMFTVSGTAIKLGATLTVDTAASKMYIGAGTYADVSTPFYVDSAGKFSLGGALTWDGTTLSISSPPVVTVDWTTQVTSRPVELTDGRIALALSSAGIVISGAHPGINVTTGAAGLYMGADFMGYYNGSLWRTYMDNAGRFYLGGTSGALQWNGTTLSITGNINVTSISGLNYAGSPTAGGLATAIVGQGALATLSSVNYNTQLTNAPTNAAGALLVTVSPSGSGLFMGADHLGYYASGAWKTYMDNAGNFYLGGTSGSLQWNGTTLTIVGGGTFSGALSAATGTFSGSLSAATGTFTGTLSAPSGTIGGFTIGASILNSSQALMDSSGIFRTGPTAGDHVMLTDHKLEFSSGIGPQGFLEFSSAATPQIMRLYSYEGLRLGSYFGGAGTTLDFGLGSASFSDDVSISGQLNVGNIQTGSIIMGANLQVNGFIRTNGPVTIGGIAGGGPGPENLLMNSGHLAKLTSDGWTPKLFDGTNELEFQSSGGSLFVRINGGGAIFIV